MKVIVSILFFGLIFPSISIAIVDQDGDGMSDVWEMEYGFDVGDDGTVFPDQAPLADPDGDGINNLNESIVGLNPYNSEIYTVESRSVVPGTFGSFTEINSGTNHLDVVLWGVPGKHYQLMSSSDLVDWTNYGTPLVGVGAELIYPTDFDLLTPAPFWRFWRVEVFDLDTDLDLLSDYEEGLLGFNPNGVSNTDGDNLGDEWEYFYFGSSDLTDDADPDMDELINLSEYQAGTNPSDPDTDQDGMQDGEEISYGLDPLADDGLADPDEDRYPNIFEIRHGYSPVDPAEQPNNLGSSGLDYYVVNPTGGGDFLTLQGAVNALGQDFGIIEISPDTYTGVGNTGLSVSNYKTLLIAPGGHTTVTIDGVGTQSGISLNAGSMLSGLTLIDFQGGALVEVEPKAHRDLLIRDYLTATTATAGYEVTWHP